MDWRQIEKSTKSHSIPTLSLLGFHLTWANHGLQVYIEQNKESSIVILQLYYPLVLKRKEDKAKEFALFQEALELNQGTESRRVPKTYLS